MRVMIALAVLFFLQAMAFAVPYNATIGPYVVSFDMGFSNYYITEEPWNTSGSLSGENEKHQFGSIDVYKDRNHNDRSAKILIQHWDKDRDYLSPSEYVKTEEGIYAKILTMDGVPGTVELWFNEKGMELYIAQYHPSIDPKRLNLTIISNYPWDDGTLQLLETIHIEEKNTTGIDI